LSARLERFDVTAPIAFVIAGLLLSRGPLAVVPSHERDVLGTIPPPGLISLVP
jgi:hypothetical protein